MHRTVPRFWQCLEALPAEVQEAAEKNYQLLQENPNHPSLHFKKVGRFWSARVGLHNRVLAVEGPNGLVWFWIGEHSEYDRIVG